VLRGAIHQRDGGVTNRTLAWKLGPEDCFLDELLRVSSLDRDAHPVVNLDSDFLHSCLKGYSLSFEKLYVDSSVRSTSSFGCCDEQSFYLPRAHVSPRYRMRDVD